MRKVKVAGVDEDGKTKKMAVVINWRWEQGANEHDHSVSGKSADEAITGEPGAWDKTVTSFSQVWGCLGLSMLWKSNSGLPSFGKLLKSKSTSRKQLFSSWGCCYTGLDEFLLNGKKYKLSLLTKWNREEILAIWVPTMAGYSLLIQRRDRKSRSQKDRTTPWQITGKRRGT